MAKRKINKSGNVILFKNQTRDDFENNDSLPTTSSFNETSWVDIDPTQNIITELRRPKTDNMSLMMTYLRRTLIMGIKKRRWNSLFCSTSKTKKVEQSNTIFN